MYFAFDGRLCAFCNFIRHVRRDGGNECARQGGNELEQCSVGHVVLELQHRKRCGVRTSQYRDVVWFSVRYPRFRAQPNMFMPLLVGVLSSHEAFIWKMALLLMFGVTVGAALSSTATVLASFPLLAAGRLMTG